MYIYIYIHIYQPSASLRSASGHASPVVPWNPTMDISWWSPGWTWSGSGKGSPMAPKMVMLCMILHNIYIYTFYDMYFLYNIYIYTYVYIDTYLVAHIRMNIYIYAHVMVVTGGWCKWHCFSPHRFFTKFHWSEGEELYGVIWGTLSNILEVP